MAAPVRKQRLERLSLPSTKRERITKLHQDGTTARQMYSSLTLLEERAARSKHDSGNAGLPDSPERQSLHEAQWKLEEVQVINKKKKQFIAKLEVQLTEELQRNTQLKAENTSLTHSLLEAKVEAAGIRKRLLRHESSAIAGDPELITIAYNKCRQQLTAKEQELHELRAQHRDVVPQALHKRTARSLARLNSAHSSLTLAHATLIRDHRAVAERHQKVVTERDKLATENLSLRRSATPRPDWDRVAEHLEGGIRRWRDVTQDCHTSEELLDVLIGQLTGADVTSADEIITCKGTSEVIPVYLRQEGSVRNKRLGRRDLLYLIADIWKQKRATQGSRILPMDQFLDQYFRERYHLDSMRAEWCYSLADACQRLAHDEQVGLFWGVACGQVEEDVYHHQADLAASLLQAFKKKDYNNSGSLTHEDTEAVLREMFPLKSSEYIEDLMSSASSLAGSHRNANKIKYSVLFAQAEGGEVPAFPQELCQQARDEQESYVQELLHEVGRKGAVDVKLHELQRAFIIVDPCIEQEHLQRYLRWVFGGVLSRPDAIPLALLAARLQTGHVVRVGPKNF